MTLVQAPREELPVYLLSSSTEWATPRVLVDAQSARWGPFWLDAAATAENTVAPRYFDRETDGMAHAWHPPAGSSARAVWGNFPYTRGEKACREPFERCRKKTCQERGAHLTKSVASLGDWVAKARDEAMAWGGPVVTLLPYRPDTEWWAKAVRHHAGAGRFLGGMCDPEGGPAARYFPKAYPAAEWRAYHWEELTVDIVVVEGRVDFERDTDATGATFPSVVVTFYRPGLAR